MQITSPPAPQTADAIARELERAIEVAHVLDELHYLRERELTCDGELVARSGAMRRVLEAIRQLDIVGGTLLLTGEAGTGKAHVARAIHAHGPRRGAPFVALDCSALPEPLLAAELFGREHGTLDELRPRQRALLELARGGTLFLDEVAALSPDLQTDLLRALETGRFKRVGGALEISWDATIVAATDRDLANEAARGRFRRDLYDRLALMPIDLPPLRARVGDVPLLVSHFLDRFSHRTPGRAMQVAPRAMAALDRYAWPGNVCELKNVMQRLVLLHREAPAIELDHLPPEIRLGGATSHDDKSADVILPAGGVELVAVERSLVVQALERTQGNQSAAAKLLGISRYALRHRLAKFDLQVTK